MTVHCLYSGIFLVAAEAIKRSIVEEHKDEPAPHTLLKGVLIPSRKWTQVHYLKVVIYIFLINCDLTSLRLASTLKLTGIIYYLLISRNFSLFQFFSSLARFCLQ